MYVCMYKAQMSKYMDIFYHSSKMVYFLVIREVLIFTYLLINLYIYSLYHILYSSKIIYYQMKMNYIIFNLIMNLVQMTKLYLFIYLFIYLYFNM